MNAADNKPKVEQKAGPWKKTNTYARSTLCDIVHSTTIVLIDEQKVVFEIHEQKTASMNNLLHCYSLQSYTFAYLMYGLQHSDYLLCKLLVFLVISTQYQILSRYRMSDMGLVPGGVQLTL